MFELFVKGFREDNLEVISFRGKERISSPYTFDIEVASKLEGAVVCKLILSAPACFRVHAPNGAMRAVRGIVNRVDRLGQSEPGRHRYRVRVVSRLWLLTQRRDSRIFQDTTVRRIVETVLGNKQIAFRWAASEGRVRSYCVQYEETDFDFVKRLLAEEGIYYFFEPPSEEDLVAGGTTDIPPDTVVFGDAPSHYAVIEKAAGDVVAPPKKPSGARRDALSPAPLLSLRRDGHRVDREFVFAFAERHQVRTTRLKLRDYEYERPTLARQAEASVSVGKGDPAGVSMDTLLDTESGMASDIALTHYGHRPAGQEAEASERAARIYLEALRADAGVARGRSTCRRLAPGYRFGIEGAEFEGDYAITEVRHRGILPEHARSPADVERPYSNRFECVKSRIAVRPAPPPIRIQQVIETATVVGSGGEGTLHTDALGRIKVHFHWEHDGSPAHNSCWLRVASAWAGPGMGIQFIPRIGMEVVVGFLGGDIDRPLVLGAVHNATHPVPFSLPQHAAISGIRTQSMGAREGHNLLAFDDSPQAEQLRLRAQPSATWSRRSGTMRKRRWDMIDARRCATTTC
jgi:type VI secretion system secreted protein VgrG